MIQYTISKATEIINIVAMPILLHEAWSLQDRCIVYKRTMDVFNQFNMLTAFLKFLDAILRSISLKSKDAHGQFGKVTNGGCASHTVFYMWLCETQTNKSKIRWTTHLSLSALCWFLVKPDQRNTLYWQYWLVHIEIIIAQLKLYCRHSK